jgi:hypothetical protein
VPVPPGSYFVNIPAIDLDACQSAPVFISPAALDEADLAGCEQRFQPFCVTAGISPKSTTWIYLAASLAGRRLESITLACAPKSGMKAAIMSDSLVEFPKNPGPGRPPGARNKRGRGRPKGSPNKPRGHRFAIETELARRLEALAILDGRKVDDIIREALETYIERRKPRPESN